jgi:signal transduction histidine kinase
MSVTDSSPAKRFLSLAWLAFAVVNTVLMYLLPGEETIPYHLIWASFALLYGLYRWSRWTTWITFWLITAVTGYALVRHARLGIIGWEECSEIVLMGVLVALLIWHVNRHWAAQDRVTELNTAERIRSAHREVTARFGSHEVRTRLTIARGFTELIRDKTFDHDTRTDAQLVLSELDKASAMATQLLTLVRVEAPTDRVPIDLDELIPAILQRWAVTTDRRWSSEVQVLRMLGDAERLEAALDCLIENAVKFTEAGDAIGVTVRAQGNDVLVSVSDGGAGIPEEEIHRVTEVFHTGKDAGERAGSGLGLAIVQAIVAARGGRLEVSSAEGTGTTVTMRLPGTGALGSTQPQLRTGPPAPARPAPPDVVTFGDRAYL